MQFRGQRRGERRFYWNFPPSSSSPTTHTCRPYGLIVLTLSLQDLVMESKHIVVQRAAPSRGINTRRRRHNNNQRRSRTAVAVVADARRHYFSLWTLSLVLLSPAESRSTHTTYYTHDNKSSPLGHLMILWLDGWMAEADLSQLYCTNNAMVENREGGGLEELLNP